MTYPDKVLLLAGQNENLRSAAAPAIFPEVPDMEDTRWKQRFSSFQRAHAQLASAVALGRQRPLSQLEQQELIKAFEFTQELAWNVMKDYFEYQGNTVITGSRDAIREAFRRA